MITRERVDANSFLWPDGTVPYAQLGPWPRPDCSGYVGGLCWAIPTPVSTVTLVTDEWMHEIAMADALPGDALGKCGPGTAGNDGHIQLFRGWTGEVGGALKIAEQAGGPPGPSHHTIKRPTPGYKFYRFRDIADGPIPLPPKDAAMFRLIDPDNKQFNIYPEALSSTGWAYTPIKIGDQDRMMVAGGVGTANGSANDPNRDKHANNNWRPGTFGPAAADVRALLITDIAAKVVASLPPGQGGQAPTLAEIAAVVRAELDKTKLAGV